MYLLKSFTFGEVVVLGFEVAVVLVADLEVDVAERLVDLGLVVVVRTVLLVLVGV